MANMLRLSHQLQIPRPIVLPILVSVMRDLVLSNRASSNALYDDMASLPPAVFTTRADEPLSNVDFDISGVEALSADLWKNAAAIAWPAERAALGASSATRRALRALRAALLWGSRQGLRPYRLRPTCAAEPRSDRVALSPPAFGASLHDIAMAAPTSLDSVSSVAANTNLRARQLALSAFAFVMRILTATSALLEREQAAWAATFGACMQVHNLQYSKEREATQ